MANDEIKTPEERKCFGLREKDVLKFAIPCAASFIGTLLAIAVYSALACKPPVCHNCPPPPCHRMEAPAPGGHHFERGRHHRGEFRGERQGRPQLKGGEHRGPHAKKGTDAPRENAKPQPPKADKK